MSIPTDQNIPAKEFDKLSKYKDLEIEIQRMWKLRTSTVPVIVGALNMIKKVVRNIWTQFLVSPNYRNEEDCSYEHSTHFTQSFVYLIEQSKILFNTASQSIGMNFYIPVFYTIFIFFNFLHIYYIYYIFK